MKKQLFDIWVEMWWDARKEWALSVRAELHYRFLALSVLIMSANT
jgi:hypothetical protein